MEPELLYRDRQKAAERRRLIQGIHKVRIEHADLIDFSAHKPLPAKAPDWADLANTRSFPEREISHQIALRPRQKLDRFAPTANKEGLLRIQIVQLAEKVRIKRPTQTLIGAEHYQKLSLDGAYPQKLVVI